MIEQLLALTNEFHSSTSTMIEKFNMQKSEKKKNESVIVNCDEWLTLRSMSTELVQDRFR